MIFYCNFSYLVIFEKINFAPMLNSNFTRENSFFPLVIQYVLFSQANIQEGGGIIPALDSGLNS